MTEQEMIDANEALDYQHEEDAGHEDGLLAEREDRLLADAPEGPAVFVPTDAAGVDWVLKQMAAARSEAKLIRENAEKMARELERDAEFLEWKFGPALQTWLRAVLEGGKKKSKTLFHGVLGFRTKPAGVTVTNPAAALVWVRENLPAAVVEALDRKALADALLSTGEAVDFATLNPAEEKFYIK